MYIDNVDNRARALNFLLDKNINAYYSASKRYVACLDIDDKDFMILRILCPDIRYFKNYVCFESYSTYDGLRFITQSGAAYRLNYRLIGRI